MTSETLTFLVCGCLPILFVGAAAIFGTISRLKSANRIFDSIRNGRLKDWSVGLNRKKTKLLVGIEIISLISLVVLIGIMIIAPTTFTSPLQIAFMLLLIIGFIVGMIFTGFF